MTIAVLANKEKWEEVKPVPDDAEWLVCFDEETFFKIAGADLYINLLDNAAEKDHSLITKPFIINSVIITLKEIKAPDNILRINGWNGFLTGTNWEVAGKINETIIHFFSLIKKKYTLVADEPGFISARIIAMIINEAYFAFGENVSTKEEIDTAMKLGTNYPYGPFEWAEKIGIKNIYSLLQKLGTDDARHIPAALLQQEATK